MASDSWHVVTPISVSVKNALVDLCDKLSAGKEKTEGGLVDVEHKKRGGARRGRKSIVDKSRRGRKSRRGHKSRGHKSS